MIFDVDGTLVDSNDAHAEAWVRALAESGFRVEFSRVRPLIGMGGDKLLPRLTGISTGTAEGQAISDRRTEIFLREFVPNLNATPGAQRLLEWLRDERLALGIATSAKKTELGALLRAAGVAKFFDAETSSDDADQSKPDPDIVHAAINRLGCPPAETIMIGDTPYDVEAALRAGIGIIAFRCGGWRDEDLRGALAIYDTPDDLVDRFDFSPFRRPLPVPST